MPNNVLLPGVSKRPTRSSMKINHSKKKITKKKKNNILNQIINYLKSNPYMYSHFISPCLSSPPPEMNSSLPEAIYVDEEKYYKKKKLMERVRDYMKSDDYLYKPLINTPCFRRPASARLINHSPPQVVEQQQKHSTDVINSPVGLEETIWRKNKELLSKKISNHHHVQADKEPFNSSSSTSLDEDEEDNNMEDSSIVHPRTPAPHHEVVTTRVLRRRTVSLVANI